MKGVSCEYTLHNIMVKNALYIGMKHGKIHEDIIIFITPKSQGDKELINMILKYRFSADHFVLSYFKQIREVWYVTLKKSFRNLQICVANKILNKSNLHLFLKILRF